jgi:hypothetical protein
VSMVLGVLSSSAWLASETLKGVLGFVIIFLLFLNKNILSLYLVLVAIYRMKFYSFYYILFLRILKNSRIGFRSVFLFSYYYFLRVNHKPITDELLSIKNNCHYGKSSKGILIDKALVAKIRTLGGKESRT